MRCLYCGKGIGPIRQFRDVEFCSKEHRSQFRERYRQQLYEALAPEPAPSRTADFMERRPDTGGPAPIAVLRALPKPPPDDYMPAMRVDAAGVSADRPSWVFGQTLAAMPARPVWQEAAAAHAPSMRTASLSIGVAPPDMSAAGTVPAQLVDVHPASPPLAAAARIFEPRQLPPCSVSLPEVAQTRAPVEAKPWSPRLHAATLARGGPAATGPVRPAIHSTTILPSSTAITEPTAPAGPEWASEAGLSPAAIASEPRPVDNRTPRAFEAPGTRDIGIVVPKAPAMAAPSVHIGEAQLAQPVRVPAHPLVMSQQSPATAVEAPGTRDIGIVVPKPPAMAAPSVHIGEAQLVQPARVPAHPIAMGHQSRAAAVEAPDPCDIGIVVLKTPAMAAPSALIGEAQLAQAVRAPAHRLVLSQQSPAAAVEAPGPRDIGIVVLKTPAVAAPSALIGEAQLAQAVRAPAHRLALSLQSPATASEAPGTRDIGIVLPKAPAMAAPSVHIREAQLAQPVRAPVHPIAISLQSPATASEAPGTRDIGIVLPKAPAMAAPSVHIGEAQLAQPVRAPAHPIAMGQQSPATASEARVACPAAPIGAAAGLGQPGNLPLQEAAGNRNLRSAVAAAPPRMETAVAPHQLSALPGTSLQTIGSAPMSEAEMPVPAVPPAAAPSWGATRAVSPDQTLAPWADIALPRIDCLPAPVGAVAGRVLALPPGAGRAVRSCAVLWTLRVAHMCNPAFRMDPVRARFNDLVRANRSMAYGRDLEDNGPAKTNLRHFKLAGGPRSNRIKWQLIGAAAAILLLAGAFGPQWSSMGSGGSLPWRGLSIRQWMSQRATSSFADNFRGGLNQWKGVHPKWSKSWMYSMDGFIHPGQLALYRPSVPLADYRFEFMAQIESKSVDWVVRAHDADNYYALKFAVLQPGPRPIMAMVRYPVIAGHKGARVETPMRMMIHANTPYRVTVDVKGDRYRTYVEGQEADFWTEDRLKTGGVGFFSDAGEHARVYWVKLESHGDLLGRICGLLSGKNGEGATDKETQAMDYRHAGTPDIDAASGPRGAEMAADTAQEARIGRVLSKAASLHLDGKLDEAARELARALDGGERHPALFFALGQLQYEMQEYGAASQSYTQAALLQPLHPTAHFNAGVCLGRTERWEEAAVAFRKAISNDPARTDAHLALGSCLVQLGLHNEALDAYDRFLAHHPDHDEALFGKAVALQKRDRSSEAAELYRHILNRNPHSEEALSNLVSLSLANQDYEQVRKYAQRLAETQPRSQIALEGLAGAAFAAGDHKAAADYSRRLAELAPQVFENWFNLGVACHKAGDLANASEAYARAARVQPDSPQAHLNLGVALQEQGDLKAARAAYERALEIDPRLPGVHWNLGLAHEQLGDSEAAEKLYAQVPENSPDSDDAAFRIGHLRLERADYPGSIQAFEACLQKRPNWPEARLNLGIAHWRAGDKDGARICFQELTASGADSREALRGLAALSLENQDYDKAFEIYRQLLDSGERTPELLYNAGLICQRRGEAADAAVLYKEALKGNPQFGEALLNLGHALMSLGNEFEARSCWRKAVIAKPELAQRYFEPAAV